MWTLANVKADFGDVFWSRVDSNYWDRKLKVFKKDENQEFSVVQNLTTGETDFIYFVRSRIQLNFAVEKLASEEILSPVVIPTLSKHMEEQPKVAHKVVDDVDRTKKKICVTLLRYGVDKSKGSFAQIRFFARKKEDEKFWQIVYVN